MIVEYHRPQSIQEALSLLSRDGITTVPMAGGSVLNRPSEKPIAVVDLQALGLNEALQRGNRLLLGATLTLQDLIRMPGLQTALVSAITREATYQLRQVASVAGTLVAAHGRSPFTTAMLALDAQLTILPDDKQLPLGNFLPLRNQHLQRRLITQVTIPVNVQLEYEYIARTPVDIPIVCVAIAQWTSGRTRMALGGFGETPVLALDGPNAEGAELAAHNAYLKAEDEWASAEYRRQAAKTLCQRCLDKLSKES